MNNVFTTSLPFLLSTSAYTLQKISDYVSIDDLSKATKLSVMANMRHYRASDIIKAEFISNNIHLKLHKFNESDLSYLTEYFFELEKILNNNLLFYESNKNVHDYIDSYNNMLTLTRTFIINLLNYKKSLNLPYYYNYDTKTYLYQNICLQCGEVYGKEVYVKYCKFCGAGLNHICTLEFI